MTQAYSEVKLPADHAHYALVGRVTAEWAHFEHILDLTVWALAGWGGSDFGEQAAACITSQIMGSRGRLTAMSSLCALRNIKGEIPQKIEQLRKDSGAAGERRNRYVHDAWYLRGSPEVPDGSAGTFRSMPSGSISFGFRPVKESSLRAAIDEIITLQISARNIKSDVLAALDT